MTLPLHVLISSVGTGWEGRGRKTCDDRKSTVALSLQIKKSWREGKKAVIHSVKGNRINLLSLHNIVRTTSRPFMKTFANRNGLVSKIEPTLIELSLQIEDVKSKLMEGGKKRRKESALVCASVHFELFYLHQQKLTESL